MRNKGRQRRADRVQGALDLLMEYASFMACGIYVPDALVQKALRELRLATSQARKDAVLRRERRKQKAVRDG
jgi:hypothetical protein